MGGRLAGAQPVEVDLIREDAFAMAECRADAGWSGVSHRHEHDEVVYVLAGALSFDVGGELLVAGTHRCVFVPGGQPHTVANLGQDEARWLTVCTPPPAGEVVLGDGIRDGPARPIDQLPGRVKVLVRGSDGSGRVAIMDNVIEAGHEGPLLHHHPFDEAFYVIDGVLTFRLDDHDSTCRAGEATFAPGGMPHTFANRGDRDGRLLIVCVPAGFERYFDRVAASEAGEVAPPPEDLEAWREITVVGPRIGEEPLQPRRRARRGGATHSGRAPIG
jgi:mannose-6-phosphate isomerase-like protein (cupin superfamily)